MYEVISYLSRQKESISRGVVHRAYTVRELAEDNKLEKEIDEKRKNLLKRRKAFAKKFLTSKEIDDLLVFVDNKNKDNQDERETSNLKRIVREVKSDFEEIQQENREER